MKQNKDLCGMLKAVQDIKSDYYVGTQEAFEAIKAMEKVYSSPKKAAKLINQEIKKTTELTYPATPEKVIGLDFIFNEIEPLLMYPEFRESSKILTPLFSWERLESDPFINPEKNAHLILPYFMNANIEKISSNRDFGEELIYLIRDEYSKVSEIYSEKDKEEGDKYIAEVLIKLNFVNWDVTFSERVLRKCEKRSVKNAFSKISLPNIVDRILKDKVDLRLEYRRQILCKYLIDSKIDSYEDAVRIADHRIAIRKDTIEKFEKGQMPDHIMNDAKKLFTEAKFIRHIVGSEKNFIKKYLKN